MNLSLIAGAMAGYAAGCYKRDVLDLPLAYARKARAVANALGKPMLNVGCGTPGSSLRSLLFGVPLYGDVNVDLASSRLCNGTANVCHGDVNALPFPDKFFGSALASHIIEHVEDPGRAVRELCRVSDYVVVIVPKWWAPHTWIHPGHKWFISQKGDTIPLWK
jgi:ubiquinone/menaquinone biosynthesis C-methylase UbiE